MSSSEVRLHCVPPANVRHFWNDVALYFENAAIKGPGGLNIEGLRNACEAGERQLWIAERGSCFIAAAITDTFHEPFKTLIEFVAVGGREMDEWVHFEKQITGMAKRDIRASTSRIICRPGIMKKMEPLGYKIKGYVMERQL